MRAFNPPTILRLADGYQLGVLRYGQAGGIPVFVTHGFPGSCLQGLIFAEVANELGLDVVTFDRPGYGESSLLEFGDMRSLLERWREALVALEMRDVHVVGISGGAPFAKAWAHTFPSETRSLNLVGGIGDLGGDSFYDQKWLMRNLLRISGWLPRVVLLKVLEKMFLNRSFEDLLLRFGSWLSEPDRAILNKMEVREIFVEGMKRARQQGVLGLARDLLIFRNWRTPIENIAKVPTNLWHGRLDNIVPATMSERFKSIFPSARLHFLDQEGHYSLPILYADQIAMEIVRKHNSGKGMKSCHSPRKS